MKKDRKFSQLSRQEQLAARLYPRQVSKQLQAEMTALDAAQKKKASLQRQPKKGER